MNVACTRIGEAMFCSTWMKRMRQVGTPITCAACSGWPGLRQSSNDGARPMIGSGIILASRSPAVVVELPPATPAGAAGPADPASRPRGRGRPGRTCQPVGNEEHDHRRVDHQAVRERIEDTAEVGLDVPAAREESVDLVGDAGHGEDDARRPAVAAFRGSHQHDEHRDEREARDRKRIGKLLEGGGNGTGGHECGKDTPVAETLSLPGFVDAHSHGFQRALRGKRQGAGDFWAWP